MPPSSGFPGDGVFCLAGQVAKKKKAFVKWRKAGNQLDKGWLLCIINIDLFVTAAV